MHFSAIAASTLSVIALVSATPLASRATCNPNFQGNAVSVSVFSGTLEWSSQAAVAGTALQALLTSNSPPGTKFHVEQVGAPAPTYVFKDIRATANNIAVASTGSSALILDTIVNGNPSASEIFSITCTSCSATAASGCSIQQGGKCAQVAASGNGDIVFLTTCAANAPPQTFAFSAA